MEGVRVGWPNPPAWAQERKADFECPYCFFLCPASYLKNKRAWRDHLRSDLRPYMCTYVDCPSPLQLFDTLDGWDRHEQRVHRKIWVCQEHPAKQFRERILYEGHIRENHAINADELLLPESISIRERTLRQIDRPCPICRCGFETPVALQQHLAAHLENIALLSLPTAVEAEEEKEKMSLAAKDDSVIARRRDRGRAGSTAEDFLEELDDPLIFPENEENISYVRLTKMEPGELVESSVALLSSGTSTEQQLTADTDSWGYISLSPAQLETIKQWNDFEGPYEDLEGNASESVVPVVQSIQETKMTRSTAPGLLQTMAACLAVLPFFMACLEDTQTENLSFHQRRRRRANINLVHGLLELQILLQQTFVTALRAATYDPSIDDEITASDLHEYDLSDLEVEATTYFGRSHTPLLLAVRDCEATLYRVASLFQGLNIPKQINMNTFTSLSKLGQPQVWKSRRPIWVKATSAEIDKIVSVLDEISRRLSRLRESTSIRSDVMKKSRLTARFVKSALQLQEQLGSLYLTLLSAYKYQGNPRVSCQLMVCASLTEQNTAFHPTDEFATILIWANVATTAVFMPIRVVKDVTESSTSESLPKVNISRVSFAPTIPHALVKQEPWRSHSEKVVDLSNTGHLFGTHAWYLCNVLCAAQ